MCTIATESPHHELTNGVAMKTLPVDILPGKKADLAKNLLKIWFSEHNFWGLQKLNNVGDIHIPETVFLLGPATPNYGDKI